jgi:hypothetical protein
VITSAPTGLGVLLNSSVQATFSEPIDCATVDATSFAVRGGASATTVVPGTFDCSGATVTFTPSGSLLLNGSYTVNLTGLITDLAGNALANAPVAWSFTTREGAWTTAEPLESTTVTAVGFHDLAIDTAGNALVVWARSDGTYYTLWSNRYVAATGSWGVPVSVNTSSTQNSNYPSLGVDAQQNYQVIWGQVPAGYGAIATVWSNRFLAGVGWGTPTAIKTTNTEYADTLSLAVASDARSFATWREASSSVHGNWASHFDGTWSTPQQYDALGNGGMVAVNSTGTAAVVYNVLTTPAVPQLYAAIALAGQDFGVGVPIESYTVGTFTSMGPTVRAGANGDFVAVWMRRSTTDTNYFIWSNRWSIATGWGAIAYRVDDVTPFAVNAPDVAVNATGTTVATWADADSTYDAGGIRANIAAAGQADWPLSILGVSGGSLATYSAFASSYPKAAIDAIGNIIIVWQAFDGTSNSVWANRYVAGSFGTATQLSVAGLDAQRPRIAMDAWGNALVAWWQNDGTRSGIQAMWFR